MPPAGGGSSSSAVEALGRASTAAQLQELTPAFINHIEFIVGNASKQGSKAGALHASQLSHALGAAGDVLRRNGKASPDLTGAALPLLEAAVRGLQALPADAVPPMAQAAAFHRAAVYCAMAERWAATLDYALASSDLSHSQLCGDNPDVAVAAKSEGAKSAAPAVAALPVLLERMAFRLPQGHGDAQFARRFANYLRLSRAVAGSMDEPQRHAAALEKACYQVRSLYLAVLAVTALRTVNKHKNQRIRIQMYVYKVRNAT